MLESALSLGYNYAVLLSGQDYPLRNAAKLEDELSHYDVWASVRPEMNDEGDCTSLENRRRYGSQWLRLTKSLPPKWLRGIDRAARDLRIIRISNKEEWPGPLLTTYYQRDQLWWGLRSKGPGVPLYWGSMWMSLSRAAMDVVVSAPRSLISYFSRVPIPDEVCLQTILYNTKGLTFAGHDRRYIRWDDRQVWTGRSDSTAGSPDILMSKDLEALLASGADFGRKFDDHVDSSVLDRLDEAGGSATIGR
jgi:hypothetical protein